MRRTALAGMGHTGPYRIDLCRYPGTYRRRRAEAPTFSQVRQPSLRGRVVTTGIMSRSATPHRVADLDIVTTGRPDRTLSGSGRDVLRSGRSGGDAGHRRGLGVRPAVPRRSARRGGLPGTGRPGRRPGCPATAHRAPSVPGQARRRSARITCVRSSPGAGASPRLWPSTTFPPTCTPARPTHWSASPDRAGRRPAPVSPSSTSSPRDRSESTARRSHRARPDASG